MAIPPIPFEGKTKENEADAWPKNNNEDGIIKMPKGVKRL